MRHQCAHRKLNRSVSHRRALLRNMATTLFVHERCSTTLEKAKELRPIVEKLITLAAKDTLPARRRAYSYLLNKGVVHRLFKDIAPRFVSRRGGYTRIVRSSYRHGDAAQMAVIELVERPSAATGSKKADKAREKPAD